MKSKAEIVDDLKTRHVPLTEVWKAAAEHAFDLNRPDVPEVQRRQMKRAFFAGVDAFAVITVALADALPEDEAVARMSRYHDELRGFAEALKMGAA